MFELVSIDIGARGAQEVLLFLNRGSYLETLFANVALICLAFIKCGEPIPS